MKYLDESLIDTFIYLYILDAIVLLFSIIVFLFIVLECMFVEGSFEIQKPHVFIYYIGMFSVGYHIGRYIFS